MMSEHLRNIERAAEVLADNGAPMVAGDLRQAAEYLRSLESQLAARNQAAEAMGVLERLGQNRVLRLTATDDKWVIEDEFGDAFEDVFGVGTSLIEAVLKAGGKDA